MEYFNKKNNQCNKIFSKLKMIQNPVIPNLNANYL